MGPTWVLSASDVPYIGPINLALREGLSTGWRKAFTWWNPGTLSIIVGPLRTKFGDIWIKMQRISIPKIFENTICEMAIFSSVSNRGHDLLSTWCCALLYYNISIEHFCGLDLSQAMTRIILTSDFTASYLYYSDIWLLVQTPVTGNGNGPDNCAVWLWDFGHKQRCQSGSYEGQ